MVLVPSGENPKPGLQPSRHSLALRLTSRNSAISDIQTLRRELTVFETPTVLGKRSGSSHRKNAFGSRNFQPHLKICNPNNNAPDDLRLLGNCLRSQITNLRFNVYEINVRTSNGAPFNQ